MTLQEKIKELLKDYGVSFVVRELVAECENRADTEEDYIGWQEAGQALEQSLDRITGYGM